MLSIAVCDDDAADLRQVRGLLAEYFRARPELEGRACLFPSAGALLEAVRQRGGFDLYLLDVVMPGMDGIQAGLALRAGGDGGEVIYLTTSRDYAVDSYEVDAFFYILKPVEREKLFRVLDRAAEKLCRRAAEGILVRTPGGPRRLLLERILYAERVKSAVRYYCTDGAVDTTTLRGSFHEAVAPLLADRRFAPCGVSFAFNLRRVKGVDARFVLLDTGARVAVPRRAAPALKRAWGAYWLEEERQAGAGRKGDPGRI